MSIKKKYAPPNSVRWAVWQWSDIPSSTNSELVYLRRLRVIQTPLFGIYVHFIYESDDDRAPHDHPWWFCSWIVRGFYAENFYPVADAPEWRKQFWPRGSVHSMSTTEAHHITGVSEDLVTVVFVGRRVREWGFWTERGFVPWRRFVSSQGELA